MAELPSFEPGKVAVLSTGCAACDPSLELDRLRRAGGAGARAPSQPITGDHVIAPLIAYATELGYAVEIATSPTTAPAAGTTGDLRAACRPPSQWIAT